MVKSSIISNTTNSFKSSLQNSKWSQGESFPFIVSHKTSDLTTPYIACNNDHNQHKTKTISSKTNTGRLEMKQQWPVPSKWPVPCLNLALEREHHWHQAGLQREGIPYLEHNSRESPCPLLCFHITHASLRRDNKGEQILTPEQGHIFKDWGPKSFRDLNVIINTLALEWKCTDSQCSFFRTLLYGSYIMFPTWNFP